MLTRKGLHALVDGIADGAVVGGITREQAHAVAAGVVTALRAAGAVTPNYDGARFAAALADTLAERGVRGWEPFAA